MPTFAYAETAWAPLTMTTPGLAVVAVNVRNGAALVNVVLPADRSRIVAIYGGNAFLKPSTSAPR